MGDSKTSASECVTDKLMNDVYRSDQKKLAGQKNRSELDEVVLDDHRFRTTTEHRF